LSHWRAAFEALLFPEGVVLFDCADCTKGPSATILSIGQKEAYESGFFLLVIIFHRSGDGGCRRVTAPLKFCIVDAFKFLSIPSGTLDKKTLRQCGWLSC
jgi:hypothetical protein